MKTAIDDLLSEGSDFRLCNEIFKRLDAAAEALGVQPTGPEERTILLTWHASGVIGNGGFEYLFEGAFHELDPGYADTLAGFEAVGATESAAALREALGWFSGSIPPMDPESRIVAYKAAPGAERERLARRFWRAQAEFKAKLAAYVRKNQAAIEATLRRYAERMPPGIDPDEAAVLRHGALRLCGSRLDVLDGDTVVRTFDLTEWKPELARRLVWWPSAAAVLAALAFSYARVSLGLPRWVWLPVYTVAAVLACWWLESRLALVLCRDSERVEVGTWRSAELDGRTMSFVAAAFGAAGVAFDEEDA